MNELRKEEKLIIKISKCITENDISLMKEDFDNIDWEYLMQIINEQKIFLSVYGKIKDFMPNSIYKKYSSEYTAKIDKIDQYIHEAQIICNKFDFKNCIVKGFILSQILYRNPYSRDFSDIDFFLLKDDIVNASYKLEELSYKEESLLELEEYMTVSDLAKELFYHIDFEKQFKKANIHTEIKSFASNEYSQNDVEIALENIQDIEINNIAFKTLDVKETFIYLFTNAYTNFMSGWGIVNDYQIRDLIDLKQFINKYNYIFDDNLLEYIEERGKSNMLSEVMQLLKEFYQIDFNFKGVCKKIFNVKSNELLNEVFATIPLYERIFNKTERVKIYNNYVTNNSIRNNNVSSTQATNISNFKHYNYKNGEVKASTPIWPNNPTVIESLGGIILSGIDYDNNYIYINIKIPSNYPSLCSRIALKSKLYDENFIIYDASYNKINVTEHNIPEYKIYFNIKDYYKVITIKIKRQSDFEFEENNKVYYYLCYDMCIGNEYKPMGQKIAMWGSKNCYLKVKLI